MTMRHRVVLVLCGIAACIGVSADMQQLSLSGECNPYTTSLSSSTSPLDVISHLCIQQAMSVSKCLQARK